MENDDMQISTIPTQSNLSILLRMEAAINAHDIELRFRRLIQEFWYFPKRASYKVLKHWDQISARAIAPNESTNIELTETILNKSLRFRRDLASTLLYIPLDNKKLKNLAIIE